MEVSYCGSIVTRDCWEQCLTGLAYTSRRVGGSNMRYLHRLIWAALIAVVTASPALSQTTGGMSSSVGGSSLGGSAGGATGSTGGSSSSTALSSLSSTPTITAPAN